MLVVIVEHFLSKEGKEVFPGWIQSVKDQLKLFKGFIALNQLVDIEDKTRTVLELKFENIELLRIWSKSIEHDQAIQEIAKYRIRKQKSQVFEYA